MYAPNSSWNDPPIFPSIGINEKKIKLIVDNYDNFSLNMNLDTYNKKNWWKPQDHIHFTKLWQKYYIGIWHTFVIVVAIIHMLGCQMHLIMDLQKNNWRQQIYMQQIGQVFNSNPKII
jgi:hypothetical protein